MKTPAQQQIADSYPTASTGALSLNTFAGVLQWLRQPQVLGFSAIAFAAAMGLVVITTQVNAQDKKQEQKETKPALTVQVARPSTMPLSLSITANGNVAAWQEASLGTLSNGLQLKEVRVNVGDAVRRGQVLAVFANETVLAEVAQARASVAEATAAKAAAEADNQRAKTLKDTGALSTQQLAQYETAAQTAVARLAAAQAVLRAANVRQQQTTVTAIDDGVISARSATVGAVVPAGQELFRMIRQSRLEWRAEVTSTQLGSVKPGLAVMVNAANGASAKGTVRQLAPTVDPQTRLAIVYVDLPKNSGMSAGMFAKGDFELGATNALTVPQQSVVVRDGFSFVFVLKPDNRVAQVKVQTGRRSKGLVEITSGVTANDSVVTTGAGFLSDADTVRVVSAQAPTTTPTATPAAATKQ